MATKENKVVENVVEKVEEKVETQKPKRLSPKEKERIEKENKLQLEQTQLIDVLGRELFEQLYAKDKEAKNDSLQIIKVLVKRYVNGQVKVEKKQVKVDIYE